MNPLGQNDQRHRNKNKIPMVVIKRLPLYHRYLSLLASRDINRISSAELAAKVGITPSQLRQDLSWFGSFGQQGYGYRVQELLGEISKIIGIDQAVPVVLVGAGHLGKAIANYQNFERKGFVIKAIFDNNPGLIGLVVNGLKIRNITGLKHYIQQEKIEMGIITVPAEVAQQITDEMVAAGIKGILNFAPISLNVPSDVTVEHVHIGDSLMVLKYMINHSKIKEEE